MAGFQGRRRGGGYPTSGAGDFFLRGDFFRNIIWLISIVSLGGYAQKPCLLERYGVLEIDKAFCVAQPTQKAGLDEAIRRGRGVRQGWGWNLRRCGWSFGVISAWKEVLVNFGAQCYRDRVGSERKRDGIVQSMVEVRGSVRASYGLRARGTSAR